jgi:hypothetical protein
MFRDISDIGMQRVIERQMRSWELQKAQQPAEHAAAEHRPVERTVHPFVALSRMVGSGGSQIGRMVGERLGWPVFDKDLLDYIATSPETRRRMANLLDERDVGWFEEILWPVTIGSRSSGRHEYFKKLCEAIFFVARQGPAVFLGRGASFILPQTAGVRVKVVASVETCIRQYAQRNQLDLAEAKARLARTERDRAAFLNAHFPARQRENESYDLIVNTDRIAPETAAEIIARIAVLRSDAVPLETRELRRSSPVPDRSGALT